MTLGFKVPKSSILDGRKRKTSHRHHGIMPNHLISASSVSPTLRRAALVAGSSLTSISGPGGKVFLFKRGVKPEGSATPPIEDDLNPMELDGEATEPFFHSSPVQCIEPPEDKQRRIREQRRQGRERLARRWKEEVLPRILPHYFLFHVHRPYAGRTFDELPVIRTQCDCIKSSVLRVIVVQWNALREVELIVCLCRPAADQLIRRGLFPCSPLQPSLAVDLSLLELITSSFYHLTLNTTGWATLLEQHWRWNGYALQFEGSLRHRLSSCLIYYQQLTQLADIHIHGLAPQIRRNRRLSADTRSSPLDMTTLYALDPSSTESLPNEPSPSQVDEDIDSDSIKAKATETDHSLEDVTSIHDADVNSFEDKPLNPSTLLATRCLLCYGGPRPDLRSSHADSIVCLDANFSQKRRRSPYMDEPFITNSSFFISKDAVQQMEEEVASARKSTKRPPASSNVVPVANEILDDCEKSFKAAQESRSKASKNFFDDTGLMALICRHDHVLFLANLQSTGEKQYYALALLAALFKELPDNWTVGVLYDIGCQLHRSCEKFDLIPLYRHRIIWGISVFHAYGHQWACQLVYHPRKRMDFGMSDGEGCERLWSALSNLVAPLRSSNHHRRIFALDLSVQQYTYDNLKGIGSWLTRKFKSLAERETAARKALEQCPENEEALKEQWHLQVESQTKSIPRNSKRAAEKQIATLLLLRQDLKDATDQREILRSTENTEDLEEELEEVEQNIEAIQVKIRRREANLGASAASLTLTEATDHPFLAARLAAHALRERLLMRIRARKFELSRLEQHVGRPPLGNKLYTHTKSSVQRRDPAIKSLATLFNSQIDIMTTLKATRPEYRSELIPLKIEVKNLFQLDVFNCIWDDAGLSSSDSTDRWRTDDKIKMGIRALLDRDRCREERERLEMEVTRLATWGFQMATRLRDTFLSLDAEDIGLCHAFLGHISKFKILLTKWNTSMISMSPSPTFTSSLAVLDVLPSLPCQFFSAQASSRLNLPSLNEAEDDGQSSNSEDSDDIAKLEMDLIALDSDFDAE